MKEQDPRTICLLSDTELLQACHNTITDMCQKQKWQMSVPPDMSHDSDMLLCELCTRFSRIIGELKPNELSKQLWDLFHTTSNKEAEEKIAKIISQVSGEAKVLNSAHSFTKGSEPTDEYKDWGGGNPTLNKFLFDNHLHEGGELVYSEKILLKVIKMVREENWQLDPNCEGSFAFNTLNQIYALEEALRNLTDATDDKNGQFSEWHRNLKKMTKAAKELL